jgi:stage V sporulation protein B
VLQVGAGLILTLALLLLARPVGLVLGDGSVVVPLRVGALVLVPYAAFTLYAGFYGGLALYSRQAAMLSVYSVAKAVLTIGLSVLLALPGAILGFVLAPIIALAGLARSRPAARGMAPIRPILLYSAPLLLLALLTVGQLSVDLFFVKAVVHDPASAGYYTAAQNIARVPYFLSTGFAVILLPAMARAARRGEASARATVRDAGRLGFLVIAPIAAVIAGAAGALVHLMYGDAYRPAAGVLGILGVAMACLALTTLVASVLAGVGRATLAVVSQGAGLVLTTLLCVVFVPSYGATGAAGATLAGALLGLLAGTASAVRVLGFRPPGGSLVRAGAAAAGVGLAARYLERPLGIVLGLPALLLAYGVLLAALGEFSAEDRMRARTLLHARAGQPR